jgi:hypothetical protein
MVNNLTVIATDVSGNEVQSQIVVDRLSPPRFENVTPVNGSVVTTETVTINGEVHTLLPLSERTLSLGTSKINPDSTSEEGVYSFSLPNLPVEFGSNIFTLQIQSDDGVDQQDILIHYVPENAESIAAPTITLNSPSNGALLNEESFRVVAQIESAAGPLTVSFNGVTLLTPEQGLNSYNLSEIVSFPSASSTNVQSSVDITISATDSLQKGTAITAQFHLDNQKPVIVLNNAIIPSPEVTEIIQSPYLITGTVTDANLSSLLINNQAVTLQATTDINSYSFQSSVAIAMGETLSVNIEARDRSGNTINQEYLIKNTATASLSALLPAAGTELLSDGQAITLQTVARVEGLTGGERALVYLDVAGTTLAPTELTINGTLASAELILPPDTAEQIIVFELRNSAGRLLSQIRRGVTVQNSNDIPISIQRIEPENNAYHIEPNAPIEIYFNRAIDLRLLDVSIRETLHGKTYINNDPLGEDFLTAKGYTLENINRDLESVPGLLTVIPGNAGVSFSPSRFLGFKANLFVEVSYNGEELSRSQFTVRELPTFINGSITDQFNQPLVGITVALPELERSTVTNGDGGFAFGYQESGEELIKGGVYQLIINKDFKNPALGTIHSTINVQQNYTNDLTRYTLQELDRKQAFQRINSGQINPLVGGDLILDLSQAQTLFENGRTSGDIHTQFLPYEHIGDTFFPGALPLWLYSIQPKGIDLEGQVSLTFSIPQLSTGANYFDVDDYPYVVLLGYNKDQKVIEPIGVGKVTNGNVVSIGAIELTSLDYLGYAQINPDKNTMLEDYTEGNMTLQQLKAALQAE